MNKPTILFADNDPDFLKTRTDFLEQEGYQVVPATDPTEARRLLERGGVDLAILDIRLRDDDDDKDTSGLTLAKEVARTIPKVILTNFPSVDAVREALKPQLSGLSPAVDFVGKQEGPEVMIASVKRSIAVHVKKQPRQVVFNLSEQLEKDYEEARKQAIFTHRVRLGLIVIGSVVIIGGAVGVILGHTTAGALSAASGILAELLAALFSRLSEDANKRMDKYHRELLKLYVDEE
jgi:DNA-binding NtrC family response regulator